MVRSFQSQRVPREVIDAVMSSVAHAPSAGFTQGNEFLVLTEEQAVADFYRITDDPDWPMTETDRAVLAPVVVIPLANQDAYIARNSQPDKIAFGLDDASQWPVPFWDIDCGMASMLILLAAIDAGLGSWFCGIFHGEQELLDHFGVPASFRPRGLIFLGFATDTDAMTPPAESYASRRRPIEDVVHHDHW